MRKFYGIFLTMLFFSFQESKAQNGFDFSCARDTTISNCAISCITLLSRIPDVHASSATYSFTQLSGVGTPGGNGCFRNYVDPGTPGTSANLAVDDRYSAVIPLPFTFPFFGINYTSLLASTNGYVSFDLTRAGMFSHWNATAGNLPNAGYDRALIMGPYHDLDISVTTSPLRRIKYDVVGTAPHRRWILSFFKVPLFGSACNSLFQNTHQIVLYEGSGVIEVMINDKQFCTSWNSGRSMIGLQNFDRTVGYMPPGRRATDPPWGTVGMNETWRFVPSAGPTLYRSVQLLDFAGNVISTGDTTSIGNNTFQVAFPNVCPSATTSYIVKATYESAIQPGSFITSNDTVKVIRTQSLASPAVVTNVQCNGANTGSITVNPYGGTNGPYSFSLDNVNFQSSNTFSNLTAGNYTVYIKEDNGPCRKDTAITIFQPAVLNPTITTTNSNCANANGTITITTEGGTGAIQYSIDGVTFQSSGTFNVPANTYTVTVKDANGCTITAPAVVSQTNELTFVGPTGASVCQGVPVTLTTTSNATSYQWTPATGLDNPTSSSPIATPLTTTDYTLVASLGLCDTTVTVTVTIIQSVGVDAGQGVSIFSGEQVQLNATVTNASTFSWSPATGLSSTNVLNPMANPTTTTLYTLTASNQLGCSNSDTVRVTVIPYCIKPRNAFTPNGDGINDAWLVYDTYDCLKSVTARVYNRYGNKVFESKDYRNKWDGRYQNKPVPDGTYYAVIDYTLVTGRVVSVKTDVTILR